MLNEGGLLIRTPAYQRIEHDLRARIQQGQWPMNYRLPSRQNLAREYSVDLNTLQRAIASLLEDGTLRADGARGTFVARLVEAPPIPPQRASDQSGQHSERPAANPRLTARLGVITIANNFDSSIDHLSGTDSASWHAYQANTLWVNTVVSSLERSFCAAGGSISHAVYHHTEDNIPPVEPVIQALRDTHIDACVLIDLYQRTSDTTDQIIRVLLADNSLPVVVVCDDEIYHPAPHVFFDQRFAGFEAIDHLLKRSYQNLIFLAPFSAEWVNERIAGARTAVQQARLPPDTLRIHPPTRPPMTPGMDQTRLGYEAGLKLFSTADIGSGSRGRLGIIAPNDTTALGIYRAGQTMGYYPGTDYGLIGFDDDPGSRIIGLTTIRPPLEELGEEAAQLVIDALTGSKPMRRQTRLKSHLISRLSV